MASSSYCFVLVSLALVLQVFSAYASTQYIDAICQKVTDQAFCIKTLTKHHAATFATSTLEAAQAVLSLGISYAGESARISAKAAVENPNLKKQFDKCQAAFSRIVFNLQSCKSLLDAAPDSANYDANRCEDDIVEVKSLVGKFSDKASKNVMMMGQMMEKYMDIAVRAISTVGG